MDGIHEAFRLLESAAYLLEYDIASIEFAMSDCIKLEPCVGCFEGSKESFSHNIR